MSRLDRLYITLLILLFAAVAVKANAQDVTLSWDTPTHRDDGAVISSIDTYRIYSFRNNATLPVVETLNNQFVITDAEPGVYVFQVQAIENGVAGHKTDPITLTVGVGLIEIKGLSGAVE